MTRFNAIVILFLFFSIAICGCINKNQKPEKEIDEGLIKESLIKANKNFVENENERINSYIARHNFNMDQTGTGLRFEILNKGNGENAKEGDKVMIAFASRILDGESLADNDTTIFTVGKSDIPSGVHEGVQLLKQGQKARFILPNHLAFGLTGDNEKVPPHAALIYQIELLKIEKNKKSE